MSKLKKTRICINKNGIIYKILVIGFTKDGGYFIQDNIKNVNGLNYKVEKFNTNGERIKRENNVLYYIENKKPKLSHHFDGKSQISGPGIISGFLNDGSPKGLSINSMNFYEGNDGGPLFIFRFDIDLINYFDNIEKISLNNKKPGIIFDINNCFDFRTSKNKKYSCIIEGYYVLKKNIPKESDINKGIIKIHPNYGPIYLFPINQPDDFPGVIFIHLMKDKRLGKECMLLSGCPGNINKDGYWDLLQISLINRINKNKLLNFLI